MTVYTLCTVHYHSTGPHKLSVSSHRLSQALAACYVSHGDDHRSPNKKSQKPKKKITNNHKQSHKITNNHKKSQKITKTEKKITKNHKKSQTITNNHTKSQKPKKKSQIITNNHKKPQKPKKKSQKITKNHKILFHNVVTFCDFFRKNTTRHFPARPGHPIMECNGGNLNFLLFLRFPPVFSTRKVQKR